MYIVVSSPHAIEETEAMGREIKYRQGIKLLKWKKYNKINKFRYN
jgi:hypothetical protein